MTFLKAYPTSQQLFFHSLQSSFYFKPIATVNIILQRENEQRYPKIDAGGIYMYYFVSKNNFLSYSADRFCSTIEGQ